MMVDDGFTFQFNDVPIEKTIVIIFYNFCLTYLIVHLLNFYLFI